MYEIYFDNTLAISSRRPGLMAIDPVIELEENTAGTLTFSLFPSHPYYDRITPRKTKISVYFDEETDPRYVFFADRITTDSKNIKTVECYGDMAVLAESIVPPVYNNGLTVRQLLERYVGYHNAHMPESKQLTVGNVTVTDSNGAIYCYGNYNSAWDEIKEDLLDDLGGILRTRHQGGVTYLDYYAGAPRTCAQKVQFARNLLELATNMDASDICTAVIPLGKVLEGSERTSAAIENLDERLTIKSVNGGVDFVYNDDLVAEYGWVFKVVTWDDVGTASALKSKGENYLSRDQFVGLQLEATAVDLSLAGMAWDSFQLSDNVPVLSQPHGIDQTFRLTATTLRLNEPALNTYRLGAEAGRSLTKTLASMSSGSSGSSGSAASASSIQSGVVLITPSAANTPTYVDVKFPTAFTSAPTVVATPLSTVPGTAVLGCGVSNVTATGCRIYLTRTNTTATSVSWIAVAQIAASGGGGDTPAGVAITQSGSVLSISNVPNLSTITQSGSALSLS